MSNVKDIRVVPAEKGKYKVLEDFVQRGVSYGSKEVAEHEAEMIRTKE